MNEQHVLTLGREAKVLTKAGHGGRRYNTTGQCSCGWRGKTGKAPSKGGRRIIISFHRTHVQHATTEAVAWDYQAMVNGGPQT